MPLTVPFRGVYKLTNGAPIFNSRAVYPSSPQASTTSIWHLARTLLSGKIVLVCESFTPPLFCIMDNVYGRPIQTTNPAVGASASVALVTPDYRLGRGFVFDGGSNNCYFASTDDPATCVFTSVSTGFTSTQCFSMKNGTYASFRPEGGGVNCSVSTNGGTVWGAVPGGTISIVGSTNIALNNPHISQSGETVCVVSPNGIGFMRNVELGQPGVFGELAIANAVKDGDFSPDQKTFVGVTTANEIVWTDNYTTGAPTLNILPIEDNPFRIRAASGSTVMNVRYSTLYGGWVFFGVTSQGIIGFMPANQLGTVYQGLYQGSPFTITFNQSMAVDGTGNIIQVGNAMSGAVTLDLTG